MSNAVPASAPALPSSRRSLLRGLAALPLAAVPVIVAALPATAAAPDAALIAFAATAERLAARANIACIQCCDLTNKLDDIMPLGTRPERPVVSEPAICTKGNEGPDGSFSIHYTPAPSDPAVTLAKQQHKAAVEAWEAEREAVSRRIGLHVADRRHSRLWERLQAVAIDLTPMVATTAAGLAAKARVVMEVDRFDNGNYDDWIADLRSAVCREAVMIGGAA